MQSCNYIFIEQEVIWLQFDIWHDRPKHNRLLYLEAMEEFLSPFSELQIYTLGEIFPS